MKTNQNSLLRTILIVAAVVLTIGLSYVVLRKVLDLRQTNSEDAIKVKLLDAFTGESISNVKVRVYSDNGIRCVQEPCDTDAKEWKGSSDQDGFVIIPSNSINVSTSVTATGYTSGRDLDRDSEKITDTDWLLELDPDSKTDNSERRFKLLDAESQEPLVNVQIWLTRDSNCRPPECSDFTFEGITNQLGNVYVPLSTANDESWIQVSEYQSQKLPIGWVNYKVNLQRVD